MLASVARGITPISQVISPPATFSITTDNTSTLTGGNGFSGGGAGWSNPTDPTKFAGIGGVWTQAGGPTFYGYGMASSIATPTNRRNTIASLVFRTSAPAFDVSIDTPAADGSSTLNIAVYVTDPATGVRKRATANDYTTVTLAYGQWLKCTFSGAADRIIEFCLLAAPFHTVIRGVSCTTGYSIIAPPIDTVRAKVVIVGDSHVDHTGSGNTNPARLCYPDYLGERLGTQDVWCSSVGGRGFLNPSNSNMKYRDSIGVNDLAISLIGQRDAVILAGTTNDDLALNAAYTDAAIQTEVQLTVAAAMVAQPNALIIVPGPFGRTVSPSPNAHVTPQSRYDAIQAGVLAAANGDSRVIYINNSPAGTQWITSGNVGTLVGPDGTHLNNAGMSAVGYALGDAIIAACTALAA